MVSRFKRGNFDFNTKEHPGRHVKLNEDGVNELLHETLCRSIKELAEQLLCSQ